MTTSSSCSASTRSLEETPTCIPYTRRCSACPVYPRPERRPPRRSKEVYYALQLSSSPSASSAATSVGSASPGTVSLSFSSAPDSYVRGPVLLRTSASSLLASLHGWPVRMLPASASTGALPVHAVAPLSELLQRVRMAEVHSAVPHLHAEPAGSHAVETAHSVRS